MLSTLRIRNLALVADLTLELQPGCNVITGETGAGKSILIGALNLVLGERADRALIRSGEDSCSVEAVFDIRGLRDGFRQALDERGIEPCQDGQLILKRTLSAAGANRQFVNGSPVTLPILAGIGEWLVDIHGPHEHQSLLHPARQLAILDAFGGLDAEREAFSDLLRNARDIEDEKRELVVDERTYAQQLDLLRFQVKEIEAAALKSGEQEQIEADHKRASNAARILELGQTALELLSEEEGSAVSQARAAGRSLQELKKLDSIAAPLLDTLEQGLGALVDLQHALSAHLDRVEIDPERLSELEERLNLISSLKRKYGSSVEEVIRFGEDAAQKLQNLEQRDERLSALNAQLDKLRKELWRAGKALSAKRSKIIPVLASKACAQLEDLGFKQSRLDVLLTSAPETTNHDGEFQFAATGLDTAEFLFAPNPGEPARPLRAIASSGELARVMLALKTVLAAQDQVPVLVFDEVDANVGGQTARAIGQKMSQISKRRQVLCITHSPHVAAPAAAHFVVSKHVQSGRTVSEVRRIGSADRIEELARMLGGPVEAARKHARALLD